MDQGIGHALQGIFMISFLVWMVYVFVKDIVTSIKNRKKRNNHE